MANPSAKRVQAKVAPHASSSRTMVNVQGGSNSIPAAIRKAVSGVSIQTNTQRSGGSKASAPSVPRKSQSSNTVTNTQRQNKGGNASAQLPSNKKQGKAGFKAID